MVFGGTNGQTVAFFLRKRSVAESVDIHTGDHIAQAIGKNFMHSPKYLFNLTFPMCKTLPTNNRPEVHENISCTSPNCSLKIYCKFFFDDMMEQLYFC